MDTPPPPTEHPRVARRRLREQIDHRMPHPAAVRRVAAESVANDTRLSGPRDDVLGYAAFLIATDTGWGPSALDVVAVEEDGDTLTVRLGASR